MKRIQVIDSHTGGEPTRVIIEGGPDLGGSDLLQRRDLFREQYDHVRSAAINEPRGSDVLVGALLTPPTDPTCVAGVIFFNNVGYLNSCGHGTIGLMVTLAHLGRIEPGEHRIETPIGIVTATLEENNHVTLQNVPSFRYRKDVAIEVENHGTIKGDVAWGGNWFFMVNDHGQELSVSRIDQLTDFTWRIRQALERDGITGENGGHIDHIDLFGPPTSPDADSKNFVLCPGKAYDRSPCGTGTSAKVACLLADGKLKPGEIWRQESIIGSVFEGWGKWDKDQVIPYVRGSAWITAEATLLIDEHDPLRDGIRA